MIHLKVFNLFDLTVVIKFYLFSICAYHITMLINVIILSRYNIYLIKTKFAYTHTVHNHTPRRLIY